jgi:glycosyltransferase involved in cell wall biosynthesis
MQQPWPVLLMVRELSLGGTERQLTETAKSLDRSQFTPHVACLRPQGLRMEELQAAGVPIFRIPVRSFYSPAAIDGIRQLGAYLRRHNIQLVHTFDTPMNLLGAPAARFYRTPVVLSSQRAYRALTPPVGRHLLRITDRLVDGVVVNCKAIEKHLIQDEKLAPARVHLCYNGIDTELFRRRALPRPDYLQSASIVIGVVCALRPEKGLDTLLEAFARVRPSNPQAKLVLIGSGPAQPGLEALAAHLGLTGSCIFEPATTNVADWLSLIDIFVLPSLSEALSNSLMEAMACGCCVIASQVGGNPELVSHGNTGLLSRPADADDLTSKLQFAIENKDARAAMAQAATRFLHDGFSLTAAARRMGHIYSNYLTATD